MSSSLLCHETFQSGLKEKSQLNEIWWWQCRALRRGDREATAKTSAFSATQSDFGLLHPHLNVPHSLWIKEDAKKTKQTNLRIYQSVLIWPLNSTLHDEQGKSETSIGTSSKGREMQNLQSDLIKGKFTPRQKKWHKSKRRNRMSQSNAKPLKVNISELSFTQRHSQRRSNEARHAHPGEETQLGRGFRTGCAH